MLAIGIAVAVIVTFTTLFLREDSNALKTNLVKPVSAKEKVALELLKKAIQKVSSAQIIR